MSNRNEPAIDLSDIPTAEMSAPMALSQYWIGEFVVTDTDEGVLNDGEDSCEAVMTFVLDENGIGSGTLYVADLVLGTDVYYDDSTLSASTMEDDLEMYVDLSMRGDGRVLNGNGMLSDGTTVICFDLNLLTGTEDDIPDDYGEYETDIEYEGSCGCGYESWKDYLCWGKWVSETYMDGTRVFYCFYTDGTVGKYDGTPNPW